MNRLSSKSADAFFSTGACANSPCGATQVGFTYTQTGKRRTMTDASGTTTYNYDSRDRLQSKQTPFGTLTYTYDNASNLTSIVSSNGNGAKAAYAYDKLNRLQTVTDNAAASAGAANAVTTYGYDPAGNLKSVAYPNTVTNIYNYDLLNRLTKLTATTPTSALAEYQYAAGNRTAVSELSGRSVQYGYDDIYRLTSETIAGATSHNGTISYAYQVAGETTPDVINRRQITSSVEGIPTSGTLFYDANDRTATDNYDNNGNTIGSAGDANVYDFENHMVQHGAVTIVYDGDGNRVSETAGGTTTNYLVDTLNPTGYVQVVDELQGTIVTRSYAYGLQLIDEGQPVAGSWKLSFYGYDGHGSVRYLTDAAGTVADTYDYDAFGNLLASTGSTPNNYLFAGEQWDPNLGLYYNRARYLDVASGRFLTMDTAEGSEFDPPSLHRYAYVAEKIVNNIDPSGQFDVGDLVAAISIASNLYGVASLGYHIYQAVTAPTKDQENAAIFAAYVDAAGITLALVGLGGGSLGPRLAAAGYTQIAVLAGEGLSVAERAGAVAGSLIYFASSANAGGSSRRNTQNPNQVTANKAAGDAKAKAFINGLRQQGTDVVGEQIYIETTLGDRIADAVIRVNGKLLAVEVKSGGGVRTALQFAKDIEINTVGGDAFGTAAEQAGIKGAKITATRTFFIP